MFSMIVEEMNHELAIKNGHTFITQMEVPTWLSTRKS